MDRRGPAEAGLRDPADLGRALALQARRAVLWSEELVFSTPLSVENLVRDALQHDLGAISKSTLLNSNAATSVRPAGLFNGATAVTASTATSPSEAMAADLGALAGAVASNAPDAAVVVIANPKQAARLAAAGYVE